MDTIEVNRHPETVENTVAIIPNDNREIISNEPEESTTLEQSLIVDQVQLRECGETQLGNRNVFHGSVDVNNIFEIIANEQFAKSSSTGGDNLTTLPAIDRAGAVGADLIPQHVAAVEIIREFNENLRSHERRNVQSSEHLPLINKAGNGNRKFRPKYIALLIIVSCVLCVSVILVVIYGHRKEPDDLPPAFTHLYRDRSKWYALKPKKQIPSFTFLPPLFVVVSQTISSPCSTPSACSIAVRNVQAAQMAASFDDIAYNFLVAGDGLIYEGRGWRTRSAETTGMGCSSLGVAFVGKFMNVTPPQQQIDAFKLLLDTAESTGRLKKNYKMFMQKDILDVDSPGQQVVNILEKWDHAQPFGKEDLVC